MQVVPAFGPTFEDGDMEQAAAESLIDNITAWDNADAVIVPLPPLHIKCSYCGDEPPYFLPSINGKAYCERVACSDRAWFEEDAEITAALAKLPYYSLGDAF